MKPPRWWWRLEGNCCSQLPKGHSCPCLHKWQGVPISITYLPSQVMETNWALLAFIILCELFLTGGWEKEKETWVLSVFAGHLWILASGSLSLCGFDNMKSDSLRTDQQEIVKKIQIPPAFSKYSWHSNNVGLNRVGPLMWASFDMYTTYVYDQRLIESVDAKSMDMRANLGLECMWILVSMMSPGTGHLQMPRDNCIYNIKFMWYKSGLNYKILMEKC